MLERWRATCQALRAPADADAWFTIIEALHGSPVRAYHNLTHVAQCLELLEAHRSAASEPLLIELALWFHDCVYVPGSKDNEARSAAVGVEATRALGLGEAAGRTVQRLILATRHTAAPTTADEALLLDIDMSILAQPDARYRLYTQQIRSEFAFVSDADFTKGRSHFLAGLLGRERIFFSGPLGGLEREARANIRAELERLTG